MPPSPNFWNQRCPKGFGRSRYEVVSVCAKSPWRLLCVREAWQWVLYSGHFSGAPHKPQQLKPSESEPPKRGRKTGAARKLPKSVENIFDTFWRFLSFLALREKRQKVSKIFLTLFDDFWRFLTWPLSAGPFCGPLTEEPLQLKAYSTIRRALGSCHRGGPFPIQGHRFPLRGVRSPYRPLLIFELSVQGLGPLIVRVSACP